MSWRRVTIVLAVVFLILTAGWTTWRGGAGPLRGFRLNPFAEEH